MKKVQWNIAGYIVLVILAIILLYRTCATNIQASPTIVIKNQFVGEYSQNGGEWKEYDKNTNISSYDGDVILRGNFTYPLEASLSFYTDHIGVSIYVDGEPVAMMGRINDDVPELICGRYWNSWIYEGENPEQDIEIHLHNPHKYGNAGAYDEFINSFYLGAGDALERELKSVNKPYETLGIFIFVVSIAILGIAIGYFMKRLPESDILFSIGLMSLFMSGYILMDKTDVSFKNDIIVLNTAMRQLCIMFMAYELINGMRILLSGKQRKLEGIALAVLGCTNGLLIVLSAIGVITIYDSALYWAIAQGMVIIISLAIGTYEYSTGMKDNKVLFGFYMALALVMLLELCNSRANLWRSGIVLKTVFVTFFVIHLVEAVIIVSTNHRESQKAQELAGELKNNRIVLAMSQIRTHFIFNVLTAISGMCEYDPKKADATLIKFSRYLRNNIDIMQDDELEPFLKSVEHLEDYIDLEQLRFGSRLKFVKEFEVTDFKIPPLVLQPIVENSLKHGLFPKVEGGTVTLSTKTDGKNFIITVSDDGVGYNTDDLKRDGSVGIDNVRFRLEYMVKGRMDIESNPGVGTKVTIIIPCKEAGV